MSRKPKFRPQITRVKLNPEQAVLGCPCWNTGYAAGSYKRADMFGMQDVCYGKGVKHTYCTSGTGMYETYDVGDGGLPSS